LLVEFSHPPPLSGWTAGNPYGSLCPARSPNISATECFTSPTAEAALKYLRNIDAYWQRLVNQLYAIAEAIDQRSQHYIFNHSEHRVTVGSILFDRIAKLLSKAKLFLRC